MAGKRSYMVVMLVILLVGMTAVGLHRIYRGDRPSSDREDAPGRTEQQSTNERSRTYELREGDPATNAAMKLANEQFGEEQYPEQSVVFFRDVLTTIRASCPGDEPDHAEAILQQHRKLKEAGHDVEVLWIANRYVRTIQRAGNVVMTDCSFIRQQIGEQAERIGGRESDNNSQ